jgi:bifunctional UDP-N-acetylglucosamine pyrophosphorylase/glucosamine-1-phosphate N-acetyltransferase
MIQAVLLLAGANNRFYPYNSDFHKGMIKLHGKPLLGYLIESLIACGIDDIIIVTSRHGKHIQEFIDTHYPFLTVSYADQPVANGQGDALLKAAPYIKDAFIIANPYHIDETAVIKDIIETFEKRNVDGLIPGVYEENIHNYAAIDVEGNRVIRLVEKPSPRTETSHYRATSAYMFKKSFLDTLEQEDPHQYSYESAISTFAKSHHVEMFKIEDHVKPVSLKYPWHTLEMRRRLGLTQPGFISNTAQIADSAQIDDTVYIDDGAIVYPGACITGHTYIGKYAHIGNYSVIRDCDIGENVHVGVYSDIARSVLMENCHSHGGGFIGDSIIGKNSKLARGFTTANKRIDRSEIMTKVKENTINTKLMSLGVIMGSNVHTGINTSTMPGVIIGSGSIVGPGVIVYKNMPEHSQILLKQVTEQTEIIAE